MNNEKFIVKGGVRDRSIQNYNILVSIWNKTLKKEHELKSLKDVNRK